MWIQIRKRLLRAGQSTYICYLAPMIPASPEFNPEVSKPLMVDTGIPLVCLLVAKEQKMVFWGLQMKRKEKGAYFLKFSLNFCPLFLSFLRLSVPSNTTLLSSPTHLCFVFLEIFSLLLCYFNRSINFWIL